MANLDIAFIITTAIAIIAVILSYIDMRRRLKQEQEASKAMASLINTLREELELFRVQSKRTEDLEYKFPFGSKEWYAVAYRTDFDLKNHMEKSGVDLRYTDPKTGKKFIPHVIEPTFGLSRTMLVLLIDAFSEEEGDKPRTVLKLSSKVAPYKAAVFPLLAKVFEDDLDKMMDPQKLMTVIPKVMDMLPKKKKPRRGT